MSGFPFDWEMQIEPFVSALSPDEDRHIHIDGIFLLRSFHIRRPGEFRRKPHFIPGVVQRIAVGQREQMGGLRLKSPAVTGEIGNRFEFQQRLNFIVKEDESMNVNVHFTSFSRA